MREAKIAALGLGCHETPDVLLFTDNVCDESDVSAISALLIVSPILEILRHIFRVYILEARGEDDAESHFIDSNGVRFLVTAGIDVVVYAKSRETSVEH